MVLSFNFNRKTDGDDTVYAEDTNELQQAIEQTGAAVNDHTTTLATNTSAIASQGARLTTAEADITMIGPDLKPSGNSATDIANLVAKSAAVVAAGRRIVTLAPGLYDFAGVTPGAIGGVYLVGVGAKTTPASYVYPFSSASDIDRCAAPRAPGGRGYIAIQVDDALAEHWSTLFPVAKELDIPLSTAWITGNGAQWIKEAHRHGWEVLSHTTDHITATTKLSNGTLEADAAAAWAAVNAVTGSDRIGFVYPEHVRSDETDRILSKYFTSGRAIASAKIQYGGIPSSWLTTAYFLDTVFAGGGGIDGTVRSLLRQVADTNGSMLFYMHFNNANASDQIVGLRSLVSFARSLGIEFVTSSQVVGVQELIRDPYFEDTSQWTLASNAAWATDEVYHKTRSVKFTPDGGTFSHAQIHGAAGARVPLPIKPGHFTVIRVSIRRKHTTTSSVSANRQGLFFLASPAYRDRAGAILTPVAYAAASASFPESGATLPIADWARYSQLVYIGPDAESVAFGAIWQNAAAGAPVAWLDEFRAQLVDFVPLLNFRGTLAGTSNVWVRIGLAEPTRYVVDVLPDTTPAGTITRAWDGGGGYLRLFSSNSGDTMGFTIRVTPKSSFNSDTLSEAGA